MDISKIQFIETEPYEKGFAAHYDKEIKPEIEKFENNRQLALKQVKSFTKYSIIIAVILVIINVLILKHYNLTQDHLKKFFQFDFFIICCLGLWVYYPVAIYSNSIKADIFPKVIAFYGKYKYSPQCSQLIPALKASGIIPTYNQENSKDSIKGEYKGVGIDFFDTVLSNNEESQLNNKNNSIIFDLFKMYMSRSAPSVFKGIVLSLTMNKKFQGKTLIKNNVSHGFFDKLSEHFQGLQPVKLEDQVFSNNFQVHSDDQVEARYLLTTAFMERLLKLKEAYQTNYLECSFYDNKLLMMIGVSRDLFKVSSVYKSADFIEDSKRVLRDMNSIFETIEILKLQQNIGM